MNYFYFFAAIFQIAAIILIALGRHKVKTDAHLHRTENTNKINEKQDNNTNDILDGIKSSNHETNSNLKKIEKDVKEVNQNLTDMKKHETFKIAAYSNEYDLFKLSLLNNTNNAQYLKEVNLIIKKRHVLKYQHIYQNIRLYENEIIPFYIHTTKKVYKHKPNIFIPPKKAENLNFKLYTDDEHFNFEFIEIEFQIVNQNDKIISTELIIHFIGQINASPKELSYAFQRDKEIDAPIINKIKKSSLNKSQRTKQFLQLYDNLVENK